MLLYRLSSITDNRGGLTVIEKKLPFIVKRVFFLHDLNSASRGGHGHIKGYVAILASSGNFKIRVNNGLENKVFEIYKFQHLLLLNPEDWHILYDFSDDCVVTVLCSEEYNKDDYFFEEPR